MNEVKPGVYQHFKGNYYYVFGVARHTELSTDDTPVQVVIYMPLYESLSGWGAWQARPLENFVQTVTVEGKEVPRFRFVR